MVLLQRDAGFVEVADRVWVSRHTPFDVSTSVVAGARGFVMVDTLWSERAAAAAVDAARGLGVGELVGVVDTHVHFDHSLGNAAGDVAIYAHEDAAAAMPAHLAQVQQACRDDPDQHHREEMIESRVALPTHTFSSVQVVDLGDRAVELVHPGRGHTGGDVVVRLDDADVVLAGDLVEESDRSAAPGFGAECFPMSWPLSLDLVLNLVGPDTVVVPGHGNPVGRGFVEEQRAAIGVVAETIRDLAGRGVPVADALDAAEWPYPREELGQAVVRGYAELPRAARHLPLL
ncbi:MBL fold metallo-hydrolase [Nocardioides mangrovicus]|uniref:MBL fold metallo-hydrolase n=1 Tax=Nocardioides mangrovicus TaxID=2478913 RepID=A0A3L8P2M7_9ACTN|nr:MBL fold metallo-hydrolase [Nocardioides mangrovicus]RLV49590.1 MBL fold metallo-hydrolase [Nocardioides mangrovicus]